MTEVIPPMVFGPLTPFIHGSQHLQKKESFPMCKLLSARMCPHCMWGEGPLGPLEGDAPNPTVGFLLVILFIFGQGLIWLGLIDQKL